MQGIMTKKEIDGQPYLDIGESAEYLGYSRTQALIAIKEREGQVGHDIRIKDGRESYVSVLDLDQILIARRPFEARRRGLIKD